MRTIEHRAEVALVLDVRPDRRVEAHLRGFPGCGPGVAVFSALFRLLANGGRIVLAFLAPLFTMLVFSIFGRLIYKLSIR